VVRGIEIIIRGTDFRWYRYYNSGHGILAGIDIIIRGIGIIIRDTGLSLALIL
jgi:hypothetical protein